MKVGCVKEIKKYEYRVGMTPDNARAYVSHGHEVFIESGAGEGSGFADAEYLQCGATLLPTAQDVWAVSDMIVKVKEPLEPEYPLMRPGQILYTYLHLAADKRQTEAILTSDAIGVAYETITDQNGALPLLKPMSEIAGRLSIQEGAKFLEKPFGGCGVLLGGVPGVKKGKVTIIGAGVVGANACAMAVGLGADVTILDLNLDRMTYLSDLFGSRIQTLYSTQANLEQAICGADLVIGAVLIPGASAPKLIKREFFAHMKPGSVIVDVAVDQGGCCETTRVTYHDAPTFVVDGVVHYCVANMPGAVPYTSTMALTNTTLKYGLTIADYGIKDACKKSAGFAAGVNVYRGNLVCKEVAQAHRMEWMPLEQAM